MLSIVPLTFILLFLRWFTSKVLLLSHVLPPLAHTGKRFRTARTGQPWWILALAGVSATVPRAGKGKAAVGIGALVGFETFMPVHVII